MSVCALSDISSDHSISHTSAKSRMSACSVACSSSRQSHTSTISGLFSNVFGMCLDLGPRWDRQFHWHFPSAAVRSFTLHYCDVIMSAIASQITSVSIVYSTACSDAYQRKHQSSASLVFVRGFHRWPVNSPHKGPLWFLEFCMYVYNGWMYMWHMFSNIILVL